MRRLAEITAFLGLSAAVHAGVMAGLGDSTGGPQGQGMGGADRVTLQAAPESLAVLAERWTSAPETAATPAALAVPELSDPMPDLRGEAVVANRLRPAQPAMPSMDSVPARSTQPPALPRPVTPDRAELAATISPRPMQRPVEREVEVARPQAASAPQAARAASGEGGGATQGAAAAPAPTRPALSAAQRQSLMSQWGGQIMARIERARPRVNASGQVTLALQVARGGQLAAVSVARSSGNPALDDAALSAVRRAGRFPAAPEGLTDASYGFSLPIRFR